MSKKIASLYAEISADTNKLDRGLKNTKKVVTDFKTEFANLAVGINQGLEIARKALETFKKAYQFGKEGAQLDFLRTKFDRLSTSIGTTGDALLIDLRRATHNMRSDAELVASAGDLMALGLAKTREEAVRLTTVAGALNMDMNQLVLTLTNQTTMRFDALNVSVDGFADRLDKLKRAGLDANSAFKEAFLQQAEEQIKRIGDVADSGVAAFNQLEVSVKNAGDALKQDMAPTATDAAKILNSVAKAIASYKDATVEANKHLPKFLADNELLIGLYAFGLVRIREMTEERQHEAQQLRQLPDTYAAATDAVKSLGQAAKDTTQEIKEEADALRADLAEAVRAVRDAEADWMKSTGEDVADALEEAGLKGQDYRTALGLIDDAYNTGMGVQYDYKEDVKELAKNYADGKLTGEQFKQALSDIKGEYMPLNEQVREANDQLWQMQLKWQWFQKNNHLNLTVDITQNGSMPTGGGGSPSKGSTPQNPTGGSPVNPGAMKKEAVGGQVFSGNMYTWNEPRDEQFVAAGNGYILSKRDAQQAAGGGNITVHIHGNVDSEATARKYAQYTAQYIRRRA